MAEGGVPDLDTQKSQISELLKTPLQKGDIWYLVDSRWFKQFKTYVGYESWDPYNRGHESFNPGPVDNSPLFDADDSSQLKESLIEDLDFMLLPADGWNKLVSWYSLADGQTPLPRKVIEEGLYTKNLKVEVYPWHLKICENSALDNQILKEFSRSDTIEHLEQAMRQQFDISEDKEVRLWNQYSTNNYEHLNKKQNTLQDAGLFKGQVIIIEQKNHDGTWPRQVKEQKKYTTSSSGSSFSTRSGNSYGISDGSYYYSGYDGGRDVATPGLCGLANLGNTCFMNSALQCMSNVPKLTQYFLSDRWKNEINTDNPLGMHGEIARSFAELIGTMWSGKYSHCVPRNFKYAVGRFAPQFSGYQQQDSQELMAFLLDGLHEDLNRIIKKPYVELKDADGRDDVVVAGEAWDNYKKRNDSIIVDIFHGLLKSTVHCPECPKISVTFDPFCYLSLPLPVKKERQLEVFWIPLDSDKKPVQFKLTVPKMGIVQDLCEALSNLVHVQPEFMVVTDVYNHRFHKVFTMSEALNHIMDRDDIFIYHVPVSSQDDPNYIVLPVYLRERRTKGMSNSYYTSYHLFGQPLLLPVPKKACTYEQLYNLVLHKLSRIVQVPAESDRWWVTEDVQSSTDVVDNDITSDEQEENNSANNSLINSNINSQGTSTENAGKEDDNVMETSNEESSSDVSPEEEKSSDMNGHNLDSDSEVMKTPRLFKFSIVNSYGSAELDYKFVDDGKPLKLNSRMYVAVDWHDIAREKFYDEQSAESFEQHESMKSKGQKRQVIQLDDCLQLFTTTEKLGENDPWYCPDCKKHQQATKKFDLWSLPDVLIIHLKRFSYNRYWRDKLDTLVEFPTQNLDLSKYVIGKTEEPLHYDLIGVVNHYGGLGGGHYTAYCMSVHDNDWHYFDDSSVSSASEERPVTKAAYVLVYQKKGSFPSNKEKNQSACSTASDRELNGDINSVNGMKNDEEMDTN